MLVMFVVPTLRTFAVLAEVKLNSEELLAVVVSTTDVVPICVVELDCEEDGGISRLMGRSVSKVIVFPFVSFKFTAVRFIV
jgi:hypothetical protein